METEGTECSQVKQGDLPVPERAYWHEPPKPALAGVRASVVALKPGNSGGAKGCRKVDYGENRVRFPRIKCSLRN